MNKKIKTILSLILSILMLVSAVPVTTFAANTWCSIVGHDMEWKVTKEATCAAAGEETYTCTREGCGYTEGKPKVLSAIAHIDSDSDNLCDVCSTAVSATGRCGKTCDYVLYADGTLVISGTGAINAEVFYQNEEIKSVIIEDGITEIGADAFNSTAINSVSIGNDVTVIGSMAFYSCGSLTSVVIPDSVTTIGDYAFYNCDSLISVDIGDSVTTIGSWAFYNCVNLASVDIGDSVTTIGGQAFCSCDSLTSVDIGDSVTTIGSWAFYKCSKIASINIPVSVKTIGNEAFRYCSSLFDVYYAGTEADWALISIGDNNTGLSNATIHFSETHTHTWGEWLTTKSATCAAAGIEESACTVCGEKQLKTIDRLPHTEVAIPAADPTCDKVGNTEGSYCSVCNAVIKECEIISATGHEVKNALSWQTKTPATCTADGEMVAPCSKCDGQATKVIPKTGHQETTYKPAVAPTCTAVGYTESKQCSVCKKVTVEAEIIEKVDHTYGEWTETKTATCAAAGVAESVCTVCKQKQLKTIDRLPHTEEEIPAVVPTCTAAGSTAGINCTVCKAKVKEVEEIPALGHDFLVDITNSKSATCTQEGKFYGKCSRCEEIKDEVIPALGHDFVVDITNSKSATCTEKGLDILNCSRCKVVDERETAPLEHILVEDAASSIKANCASEGKKVEKCTQPGCTYTKETVIPKTHEFNLIVNKEATCTEAGTKSGYCTACKKTVVEAIPATGHTYQAEWQTIIAPTCTENGISIKICRDCFNIQTSTLDAVSHSDSNSDNKCDMCSLDMTPAQPENPDDDCDCNCHKDGIVKIFFNFILFFQRIFGQNRECDCGAEHY